ncbi:MAG: hypothetical protein FJ125_07675 [Deltaproteobacteria bacterium]|nr:hypothetical protein [Deltaproteobacteria bacterium]
MSVEDDKNDWGFTRRLMGRIPDVMSRALVAGTGALFLTEEGIRNLVSELKLPGEMVRFLVQQAETTKRELFRFVGQEIRSFMEQSNLSQELLKALAGVTVEVHTTIRFVPDEAGQVAPRFATELRTQGSAEGEEAGSESAAPQSAGSEESAQGAGSGEPLAVGAALQTDRLAARGATPGAVDSPATAGQPAGAKPARPTRAPAQPAAVGKPGAAPRSQPFRRGEEQESKEDPGHGEPVRPTGSSQRTGREPAKKLEGEE